jgi:hypothetical protein
MTEGYGSRYSLMFHVKHLLIITTADPKPKAILSHNIYEDELSSDSTNDNENQRCIFVSEFVDRCERKQANGGCRSALKCPLN